MNNSSKLSFNIAYCGITVALAVGFMFMSLIPSMTYVLPAVSGIILWTINSQINRKWALIAYVAASVLSILIIPEKEAQIYFIMFFGYYPIIRDLINKVRLKPLVWIIKYALFNAAIFIAFKITCLIINIEQILSGLEDFGDYALLALWIMANIAFLCYDICINSLMYAFDRWVKPKLNRRVK